MNSPPHAGDAASPWVGAAVVLLAAGRGAEAAAPLREAARLRPGDAELWHDLGLACLEAGETAEGAAALRRAVSLKPGYADAHFRLAIALERLGDATGAVAAYDQATALAPRLTEAWFRAGALVFGLGHREEAIGCFRRAAATGPKTGFGRLGRARALLAEERDGEAEAVLRRALALDPGLAMAHDLLGNLLAEAGRFEEARSCFERAVILAPLMAGSYYELVRCRRVQAADGALVAAMQAALDVPGLAAPQRGRVHLALGKAADDLGDHATAMRHFDAADALRTASAPFDASAFADEVERLVARLPARLFAGLPEGGDATPLLVVGLPRSGTTLVEQILSSHPLVEAGGELNFWNERGAAWMAAGEPGVTQAALERTGADYLAVLRRIGKRAARVTDKMPFNFLWAGLALLACPGSVIVHCRRSAIDTALSIHQTQFNPHLAFPTGGRALVHYIRTYERLMAHWREVLPPARFIEVEYEALTQTPAQEIRRLVSACGLAWDEACLHPERNTRVVRTPSKWQARQPVYRHAVDRWRRYEPWLGDLASLTRSTKS